MRARKRFGQNFLTDRHIISKIIEAIRPLPEEHVVEVGPGHGALTRSLVESGCHLTVIEIDRDLAHLVSQYYPTAELIVGDVLKVDFSSLQDFPMRIVGNLPYNISTPLLFKLFQQADRIVDMHFMLQLEVVERMVATPTTGDYGRLSVMTQYHCQPELLFTVPPSAFSPRPRVTSAIVRLKPVKNPTPANDPGVFESLVTQAFSQRRKTIRNALKGWLSIAELEQLSLDPQARPENLSLTDFIGCANLAAARDGIP